MIRVLILAGLFGAFSPTFTQQVQAAADETVLPSPPASNTLLSIESVRKFWMDALPRPKRPDSQARDYQAQLAYFEERVSWGKAWIRAIKSGEHDTLAEIMALRNNIPLYEASGAKSEVIRRHKARLAVLEARLHMEEARRLQVERSDREQCLEQLLLQLIATIEAQNIPCDPVLVQEVVQQINCITVIQPGGDGHSHPHPTPCPTSTSNPCSHRSAQTVSDTRSRLVSQTSSDRPSSFAGDQTDLETDITTDIETDTDLETGVEADITTSVESDIATEFETDFAADFATDLAANQRWWIKLASVSPFATRLGQAWPVVRELVGELREGGPLLDARRVCFSKNSFATSTNRSRGSISRPDPIFRCAPA